MKLSSRMKTAAVTALDVSGIAWLLRPFLAGRGTILCLHRVIAPSTEILTPGMAISATQLDATVQFMRQKKWEFVHLREVAERLRATSRGSYFVAITLDDGYSDNLHIATPIFRKYAVPYAVFVNSGVLNRMDIPWYSVLEQIVSRTQHLVVDHPTSGVLEFLCNTYEEKRNALANLVQLGWKNPSAMKQAVRHYCITHGTTVESLMNESYLSWEQLRTIAEDPLATVGSHTVSHERLARLGEQDCYCQMKADREKLEGELGRSIEDIAYPYGSPTECGPREFGLARKAGFVRGVTTERWNLFPRHLNNLLALPRVTLSMAHSASERFARVCAYGAWNAACALRR